MNNNLKKTSLKTRLLSVMAVILTMSAALCGCGSSSAEDVAQKAAQAYVDDDPSAYYELLAPGYVDYVVGPADGMTQPKNSKKMQYKTVLMSLRINLLTVAEKTIQWKFPFRKLNRLKMKQL